MSMKPPQSKSLLDKQHVLDGGHGPTNDGPREPVKHCCQQQPSPRTTAESRKQIVVKSELKRVIRCLTVYSSQPCLTCSDARLGAITDL
jgi:hypothetical protein